MNPGQIWWEQIGNSIRFLNQVGDALYDCRSAVIQVPKQIPWREHFYQAVDIQRSSFGMDRGMMRQPWTKGIEPGKFVLDKLCDERVIRGYHPSMRYENYLGSLSDHSLNDYYIWITGIHGKDDLAKWVEFVSRYEDAAKELEQCAVFILEYDGEPAKVEGINDIHYSVKNHDCRVFCLEAAEALENTALPAYQAELALCIGHDDPEFSAALLERGSELLTNPDQTAEWVLKNGCNSEGKRFAPVEREQIGRGICKAMMVLLFPILEQYRCDIVEAHDGDLRHHLPITNQYGHVIREPNDLELVDIKHIVPRSKDYSKSEIELINLCWKVRNKVAHNDLVPYQWAEDLLLKNWEIQKPKR